MRALSLVTEGNSLSPECVFLARGDQRLSPPFRQVHALLSGAPSGCGGGSLAPFSRPNPLPLPVHL